MKLQYLGTAAAEGVPGLFCTCPLCEQARVRLGRDFRMRHGALVNGRLMLDFPPDAYHAMLRHGLRLPDVTDVLFTHTHGDHCCLGELVYRAAPAFCIRPEADPPLHLYGSARVGALLEQERERDLIARNTDFTALTCFAPREIAGVTVTALPANHMGPDDQANLFLLEQGGKRLFYAHDTGLLPEATYAYLAGKRLDLISFDCTCAVLPGVAGGHMGFEGVGLVRDRLRSLGCVDDRTVCVVSHFSHNGLHRDGVLYTHDKLSDLAGSLGCLAAYDGLTLEI